MATKRPHGLRLALLGTSIVCSLVSLATLFIHPEGTSSWRASLNIIAVVLVIVATTMLARGPGGRDA
jgi:hypothetical protein